MKIRNQIGVNGKTYGADSGTGTSTAKEEYEKAKAQAKARYDKIKARHATAARKLDTRRKIILGGALIDRASRDEKVAGFVTRLIENLPREQDRKVFEEWNVSPGDASGTPASTAETGSSGEELEDANRSSSDSASSPAPERVLSYYEQQKRDRP